MAFTNDRRAAVKKLKTLSFTQKSDVNQFRAKIDDVFYEPILPNRVERLEYEYGNIVCDVIAPEVYLSNRIVLYIHGGSFVGGSRASWRQFCAMIAHKSFSRVIVPEFSLAPESVFPKAVDEIHRMFRALYTEEFVSCLLNVTGDNKDPKPEFILCADGTGASIALSFLFNLNEKEISRINRVVLLSPCINFSADSFAMNAKKNADEVISAESLKKSVELYAGENAELSSEKISPANVSDDKLIYAPPIYIQMGEREILLPDVQAFAERVKNVGGICEVEAVPNMMFMFQMADEFLWESHDAFDELGKLISGTKEARERVVIENKPSLEHGIFSEA